MKIYPKIIGVISKRSKNVILIKASKYVYIK